MEIKSKLIQCPNGHYYNGALHSQCPICSGSAGIQGGVGATMPAGSPLSSTGIPTNGGVGRTMPAGGMGTTPVGTPFATMPPDAPTPGAVGATIIGEDLDQAPGVCLVVGWLVCIEGEARGRAFEIHAGYNYIGRESGDVQIPGDMQISRQNHAMIAYDPTDHIYYVGPSAGRNLIKVNGRTLFNAAEIKSYDVISIGSTKLMFISLCGERFNWSQGRLYD